MIPSTQSKRFMPVIQYANDIFAFDDKGNMYMDFTGANLTVVLGYKPIETEVCPNLPGVSIFEAELSKELKKLTGNKNYRFFKNGHDACDCAIRLAKYKQNLINRPDDVVCMGYHGTADWYMQTTDNRKGLWSFHDCENVEQIKEFTEAPFDKCGILIYESRFKKWADKVKADIKIEDTLKDGIRALFRETDADMTIYGKSIANGYPMAVLAGDLKGIDDIYYSTTYGSEQQGMIATLETIREYKPLRQEHEELIRYAESVLPPKRSFNQQEIEHFIKNGLLNNGWWQIMTGHSKSDVDLLVECYREMLCYAKE